MRKKRLLCNILIIVFGFNLIVSTFLEANQVKAVGENMIRFRIMSTADMHGKVTDDNYETLQKYKTRGLSKVATLITQARQETKVGNSILVDAGDFLSDYSTNYFYDHIRQDVQPILQAMKSLDYDYLAIGNHEFDYPWSYLKNQLDMSGFFEKALVCNTIWNNSGDEVFQPSTLVTKMLTAENGLQYSVKIGIIGATRPLVASKRGDNYNFIVGESAYNEIKKETITLKDQGADVVIAITHGGIGTQSIKDDSENVAYALSSITGIDAIVTAHTHEYFPSTDSPYNSLPNVNKSSGRINGKPVVASGADATALGVIDLTLSVDAAGKATVISGESQVRYVTESTKANPIITGLFAPYFKKLQDSVDKKKYAIADSIVYTNQFSEVQDSNLFQLINNAKIEFGVSYLREKLPAYSGMPVIAYSRNIMQTGEQYVTIRDNITKVKLSQVVSEENANIGLYVITGSDLREWLEYSASAYAKPGTKIKNYFKYLTEKKNISTLLQQDYVYDKTTMYHFDGISYDIDIRKPSRYTKNGKLISKKNKRITKLTYNGKNISNNQKFILVSDNGFKQYSFMPKYDDSIMEDSNLYLTKDVVYNYIKRMSSLSKLSVVADNNWKLVTPKKYSFLISGAKGSNGIGKKQSWYQAVVAGSKVRNFYHGVYKTKKQVLQVNLSTGILEKTNQKVPIIVTALSSTTIKSMKWIQGSVKSISDAKWNKAKTVKKATFTATKNGTYSVLVTDKSKNKKIARIKVRNISNQVTQIPKVDGVTNRKREVTGTAEPHAVVYVQEGGVTYHGKADEKGVFSIGIKPIRAYNSIVVWAQAGTRSSTKQSVWVRYTGANTPSVDQPSPIASIISGKTDRYTNVYALIRGTVYVGRGQTKLYQSADLYQSTYNIVETDITIDGEGNYTIQIPMYKAGVNVYVFAIDRLHRSSVSEMKTMN